MSDLEDKLELSLNALDDGYSIQDITAARRVLHPLVKKARPKRRKRKKRQLYIVRFEQ